jgi:hypothetical protein
MLGFMSETPSSSEPATDPVATAAPPSETSPPVYAEPRRRNRLTAVAAWVGIVAGVVFIVAVVFFSGFILGAHSGGGNGGWGHGHRHHGSMMMHRGGPPMFPMGPRGDFDRPGPGMQPQFGPSGPNLAPQQPSSPTTTAPRP